MGLGAFWQIWLGRMAGSTVMAAARTSRLQSLVAFARSQSPLYRELYQRLPDDVADCSVLPVTTKAALMARFDDWLTDRNVTRPRIDAFLADRTRIGDRFDSRYVVWKSSGTSGREGIFVQDDDALNTYDALLAVQLATPDLAMDIIAGSMFKAGRAALIAATGDHFASIASWERVCRATPMMEARGFSVMEPLAALVAKLNEFRPAYLASYPTMLALLADEKRRGRLRIEPSLVWSGGEYLGAGMRADLEAAFGCRVMNEYGASECLSIAFGCPEGWLHVNADWAIVEPVDAAFQPIAPGQTSHTVLITNLANRVQPIIRYDLGDAVVVHPGRCACGSRLQAIRVEGRRDDVVVLDCGQREAHIAPMALTTIVEEATHEHRFQIVQSGSDRLLLRFADIGCEARETAFHAAVKALRPYLASQGVASTRIVLDALPPTPDRRSGKLRQVIVESRRTARRRKGVASVAASARTARDRPQAC